MNYEEKYNKALERAKKLYERGTITESLGHVFPELKENVDEKIRKEIISALKYANHKGVYNKHLAWLEKQGKESSWKPTKEQYEALDYAYNNCSDTERGNYYEGVLETLIEDLHRLEKQGEQKNKINSCKITFEDVLALECAMKTIKITEGGNDLYEMLVRLYNKVHNAYLVEKQGETFTKKDVDDAYLKGICDAKHELEKQVEQKSDDKIEHTDYNSIDPHFGKPIDKIEPKFKVGDWIVNKGHSYLIADIDYSEQRYLFEIGGYTHEQLNWEYIEIADKRYHLWTISDAKDGDILCDYHETYDNPLIFILKKFEHVNFGLVRPSDYSSYCFLTAGDIQRFKEGTYHHKHNIKPATKEQRDTLIKAMADAGYTFDFEKKELKLLITNGGDFESENCEQNPAWDEEDEHTLQGVIDEIQANKNQAPDYEFETYDRFLFWLKTLKQRIGG